MSRDPLMASLLAAAQHVALSEDDVDRMIEEEVERLSHEARVRDYVRLFAVRRVRDRVQREVMSRRAADEEGTPKGG
jgi:hypothetical protein